ncbi:secretogranin-2a [Conger conger]|uniref:secretogranin-2a n=1 Tax=Conger conger TaxID=82655 RepID=UPI002A5AB6F6|nr:secretogranin-2a [Conger conger]
MWSLLKPCFAAWLVLLGCVLRGCVVWAVGLQNPAVPGAEIAKALQYIEGLQQRGNVPDYDEEEEELRSRWGLQAGEQGGGGRASPQLLKTLLTSLQREDPKPAAAAAPKNRDATFEAGDYGRYPVPKHSKPHKHHPLMFEDSDEDSRDSPYKRTNENAEPQYTPQSLATLQSVFQDLGKLSNTKDYKRQSRGEDDDLYPLSDLAYEDVVGGGGWTPVEEKVETEEEIKDSREEFDRGLDNSDEAEDEDDEDDDDDDDEEENYVKRSSQPPKFRGKDDPEDFTKMVDYYLLKILERTEESEQKRGAEEERRSARPSYALDPQALYQLIQISQNLRGPPEDLIQALRNRELKKLKKVLVPQEEADDLERVEGKLMQISTYNKDRGPVTKHYIWRGPGAGPVGLANKLKILNLLGMETRGRQRPKPLEQQWKPKNTQTRYYAPSGRRGYGVSDKREGVYDDTVDEDKIVTYLAAKMLAQYPKVMKKADLKHVSQPAPQDEALGTVEQAVLDYFDQLASEKGSLPKPHPAPDGMGNSPQTQSLDDETLLKMLEYLNPESSENQERDLYGKNIGGM